VTKLAVRRARDLPTQHVRHQLHAVADAERRHAELEHARIAERRVVFRHALGAAGQNQADRLARAERLKGGVERENLAVDRQLTQASSNQLRELRAEIQYENRLMLLHEVCCEDTIIGV
jgi:hypothetical protein